MKRMLVLLVAIVLVMSCAKKSGPESSAKEDDRGSAIRVACLGASNTEGYQLPNIKTDSWPGQMQTMAGDAWEVLNAGCGGTTVMKEGHISYWISLGYRQAREFKPDVVIFDFGWNDLRPMNRDKMADNFVKDYNALIAEFAGMEQKPLLFILLPPLYETDTNDKALGYSVLKNFYDVIISQNDITPIDLHATMATVRDFYNSDLTHYSVKGCAHAAAKIHEAVSEKLKDRK